MANEDKSQRTEQPTPKRKKEARKKGQIAKSRELTSWIGLLVASFLLEIGFASAGRGFGGLFARVAEEMAAPTEAGALRLLGTGAMVGIRVVAPLLLGLMLLGTIVEFAQVASRPSLTRLKPKFERLNACKGLRKLFSAKSFWEAAKAVAKVVIVGIVAYPIASSAARDLAAGGLTAPQTAAAAGRAAIVLMRAAAVAGLVLGIADYIVQKRRIMSEIRMTKREVREELRQSEGDPYQRQAMRSRQLQIGRNRMLAAVGEADVVVVNPTHYAVALRYQAEAGAPEVLAKGAGEMAAGIRARAEELSVAIVDDPPLARSLHRLCEVGDLVPPDLFEAVARVIAFVYGLRRRGYLGGRHKILDGPPSPDLSDRPKVRR